MYISLEKYINGQFEYELPEITLSTSRVECSMYQGENFKGTFEINGTKEILGYITVSSPRMRCCINSFKGTRNVIEFEFDSRGMQEGEVIKGKFDIISNGGEYSLPFVANIEKCHIESSMGNVKNLFHFANLAQNSWNEALKIFVSPDFTKIFVNHDRQYLPLYEGLLENTDKNYAMEEFLIAIRKKSPVLIDVEKKKEIYLEIDENTRESIPLTKKNWGYFEILVESDSDFLVPYKKYLHEDDFVGSLCPFQYYIKRERMHWGKNMGKITFSTARQKVEVRIQAVKGKHKATEPPSWKNAVAALTKVYIEFRTRKINSSSWSKKSLEILEQEFNNAETDSFFKLYKVQLLLAEKRTEDAWHLLRTVIDGRKLRRQEPENYCYYLYLLALADQRESTRDKALEAASEYYEENKKSWKALWLKLYLQEEYELNKLKKYEEIKGFSKGTCQNPVIFMEAINILKKDINILTKLDRFELSILNWALKNNQFTEEMAARMVYLALKSTEFHPVLYKLLTESYKQYPTVETIQAICSILIKNDKRENKFFFWYQLGIKNDLKITRLYEYYLISMNTRNYQLLPRNVLMYFLYQCDLDYKKKAYVYANLMKNKEIYSELYEKYEKQIYQFALDEIMARHINEDLAYIYHEVIKKEHIGEKMAEAMASIMFAHRITMENTNLQRIVVRHSALYYEESFGCNGGEAYVNIYNQSYVLFGEDEYGRRFPIQSITEPERLYSNAEIEAWCFKLTKQEIGIYIHKLIDRGSYLKVDEWNVRQLRSISQSLIVKPEEKLEFFGKIADFYYETGEMEELDNYLLEVEVEELPAKDRIRMVEYMIIRKMYEKSYQYVKDYGAEGINTRFLLRICSLFLREYPEEYTEAESFCRLCHYLYDKGKYDIELLSYLIKYYQGNLHQMRDIWKSSKELELDNYELTERLLVQSLFAHSYVEELPDIFEDYIKKGARPSIEKAFIAKQSYEYFVKENITDERILKRLYQMFAEGEELPDICKLALLNGCAEKGEEISEKRSVLQPVLMELLQKGIYFEFMKKYHYGTPEEMFLYDKTILEYRQNPVKSTEIHYTNETLEEGEYQVKKLNKVYPGVETTDFILFFGEALQYYITEKGKDGEKVVESGRLIRSEEIVEPIENRYELLNDMMISKTMKDETTLHTLLDKYLKEDYITEQAFHVK
ncbi:MAG: hypothetical protein IJA36_06895 [Lachnospiraceae bacterium]|nr:hypothetical protein [Lachnospiraceae bacterium]